jgi:Holliday junction resolvasome RuvABC endonuclease subunit
MPGYSLVVDGVMVDSGILSINPRENASKRLAAIQIQLNLLTPNPDVIVIEKIAPMLSCGGAGVIQLHWACGVVLATYPNAVPVMVPNQTWKKFLRDHGINYKKSDENDAIVLMLTLYSVLNRQLKNEADIHKAINQ